MSNEYYTPTGWPTFNATGSSQDARDELDAIEDGFDLCPTLTGNGGNFAKVNAGATALESVTASAIRTLLSLVVGTNVQAYSAKLQRYSDSAGEPTDNSVPIYSDTGSGLDFFPFLDEDAMTTNSSTSLASQQSIKAYTDTKVTAAQGIFRAPNAQPMVFYMNSAPTGWTLDTGHYNRVMFINSASTATFGSANAASSRATTNNSNTHYHTWSASANTTTSNDNVNAFGGGGTPFPFQSSAHYHSWSGTDMATGNILSGTGEYHSHFDYACQTVTSILCTRDAIS